MRPAVQLLRRGARAVLACLLAASMLSGCSPTPDWASGIGRTADGALVAVIERLSDRQLSEIALVEWDAYEQYEVDDPAGMADAAVIAWTGLQVQDTLEVPLLGDPGVDSAEAQADIDELSPDVEYAIVAPRDHAVDVFTSFTGAAALALEPGTMLDAYGDVVPLGPPTGS